MNAKCPKCLGRKKDCEICNGVGTVEVGFASGTLYNHECKDCEKHIGGCIVGPDALKEVPKDGMCPFCKGRATYVVAEWECPICTSKNPCLMGPPAACRSCGHVLKDPEEEEEVP